jgi:hypothetical protein
MLTPLATSVGRCSAPASHAISARFPASDTVPLPAWKASIRRAIACTFCAERVRSAQVYRSCQTKLWTSAASTATAVAAR